MNRLFALALGLGMIAAACPASAAETRGVLYEFSTTWCGPCQAIKPLVTKLEHEGLPIKTVDGDTYRDFANKYGVTAYPTFVLVIDGKVEQKIEGAISEAQIRQLCSRIPTGPQANAVAGNPPAGQGRGNGFSLPVELGQPGQFPSAPPATQPRAEEETRVAQAEPEGRRSLLDRLPFGRREEPPAAPPVVRGNDNPLASAGNARGAAPPQNPVAPGSEPLLSSVRLRVIAKGNVALGSGTIISSRQGIAHILTCSHIFRGYTPESEIQVDIYDNGLPRPAVGKLLHVDTEADLGLVAVNTASLIPASPVAGPDALPRVTDDVTSIGCNGGNDPTRERVKVTDIDKYDGPNNVLCTGLPVQGRSGGGLFDRQGRVVGVCIAADEQEQRGFYSGLLAVHQFLKACKMEDLYLPQQSPPAAAPMNFADNAPAANPLAGLTPLSPAAGSPVAAPVPAHDTENFEAGDAEAIVILRSKSNPDAPNRIIIIHEATPKFLSYLSPPGHNPGDTRNASAAKPVPGRPRGEPYLSQLQPRNTLNSRSQLQPTSLTRPDAPQRYVRSAAAR